MYIKKHRNELTIIFMLIGTFLLNFFLIFIERKGSENNNIIASLNINIYNYQIPTQDYVVVKKYF